MIEAISVTPKSPLGYAAFAISVPLIVRILIALSESLRCKTRHRFSLIFRGTGGYAADEKSIPADYWLGFAIGVCEMLAYPLLIVANQQMMVGFWLVFKTVHRWSYAPHETRGLYNRYLLANAAILIGAYCSARWTVAG